MAKCNVVATNLLSACDNVLSTSTLHIACLAQTHLQQEIIVSTVPSVAIWLPSVGQKPGTPLNTQKPFEIDYSMAETITKTVYTLDFDPQPSD